MVHLEREKQVLLHLEIANISAQNANLLSMYILNWLISKKNPDYFHKWSEVFQQRNLSNLITIFAIHNKKILASRFIKPENIVAVFSKIFSFTSYISAKKCYITEATTIT